MGMQAALAHGADVVIQSTHKTLAALTQASMLHIQGSLVQHGRISNALEILQAGADCTCPTHGAEALCCLLCLAPLPPYLAFAMSGMQPRQREQCSEAHSGSHRRRLIFPTGGLIARGWQGNAQS